jgi:hypothetical protein
VIEAHLELPSFQIAFLVTARPPDVIILLIIMDHCLQPTETAELTICAKEHYSSDALLVQASEVYEFSCSTRDKWTDWFISSNANGFWNPLAILSGLRLRGVKCFTLCGCMDQNEQKLFSIGTHLRSKMSETASVSFFANDAFNFYDNNKGSIRLTIKRIS